MKNFFSLLLLCSLVFSLAGCGSNTNISIGEPEENTGVELTIDEAEDIDNIDDIALESTICSYISNNYSCEDGSETFVNISILGEKSLGDGNTEYYINALSNGFLIDERGNLNHTCGFGGPMKVVVHQEEDGVYSVIDSVQANDGNEFDSSLREMFSDEAIEELYKGNYQYWDRRTPLEMAEDYFGVTIIPEEKNEFECNFCDKLWYYQPLDANEYGKSNELIYNYISENNGNNTIHFGKDGTFEATGSWDAGIGTWVFGKDANTVIVSDSHAEHIYSRYIITKVDEKNLNTILEIIQRE